MECRSCGGPKPKAPGRKYCAACMLPAQVAIRKQEALSKQRDEYQLRAEFHRLAGLNSKGELLKLGWTSGAGSLTPLKQNPILDQDYETPEGPDRITKEELKWLL